MPMVRMSGNRPTNLRVYGSKKLTCRNACTAKAVYVGRSKFGCYETPYSVTGTIKHTGLLQAPKGICKDKFVGTWEAVNVWNKAVAGRVRR